MIDAGIALLIDLLLAGLLGAVILYAVRLNRRLEVIRSAEGEFSAMIARFQDACAQAERTGSRLRDATTETERSLGLMVRKAEAVRDEIAFLIERADRSAAEMSKAESETPRMPRRSQTAMSGETLAPDDEQARREPRSEAERDLIRALRLARAKA